MKPCRLFGSLVVPALPLSPSDATDDLVTWRARQHLRRCLPCRGRSRKLTHALETFSLESDLRRLDGAGGVAAWSDGASNDGPINDGPVNDGPVNDGPVNDGPVNDGPINDGPINERPLDANRLRAGWLEVGVAWAPAVFLVGLAVVSLLEIRGSLLQLSLGLVEFQTWANLTRVSTAELGLPMILPLVIFLFLAPGCIARILCAQGRCSA